LRQRGVEQLPRWADKRPSSQILLVSRLFTDEDDLRVERPFAEHRLRRALMQIAARAMGRFVA